MPSSGLGGNGIALAGKAEAAVADDEFEVLGHLVLVDELAHAKADRIGAPEPAGVHPLLDRTQVLLGGFEQLEALERAKPGQLRVATCHQPLAGVLG